MRELYEGFNSAPDTQRPSVLVAKDSPKLDFEVRPVPYGEVPMSEFRLIFSPWTLKSQ